MGAGGSGGARSALYAHVARLRRALAQADDGSGRTIGLGRHGDGYVLDVERQQVDLHRLNRLIDTGRAATRINDEKRVAALREAMDLWRGDPLATLSSDWANRVRRSVASQLISLAGAWGAEELRLGSPEAVAERLARILGSYPLAEPLVSLQMRALCAMGRTPEALQYYVDTRAQVVEQFGAEPGPELRNLHVAILRGELDEPYPGNVGPVTTPIRHVPRQLPADIARFSGRHDDLAPVMNWLKPASTTDSAPVVSIYGTAGVGKSTLAIHAAHKLTSRYPDGQLYIALRGTSVDAEPLTPVDALARLLRTLGVSMSCDQEQVDEAAALFRSVVAGRRLLLVLDNAVDAAQVRPLLPSGAGCGTLVTSRQPLAGLSDVRQLRVGPLTIPDAIALLSHWVGAERVAAEPEAATAIAEWCECLPLALRIVGARLVARPGWPLAELRDRLADERAGWTTSSSTVSACGPAWPAPTIVSPAARTAPSAPSPSVQVAGHVADDRTQPVDRRSGARPLGGAHRTHPGAAGRRAAVGDLDPGQLPDGGTAAAVRPGTLRRARDGNDRRAVGQGRNKRFTVSVSHQLDSFPRSEKVRVSTKELDAPQAFPEIAVPVTAVPRKRWHTVARRVLMSLLLTVTVVFIVLALRGQDWSTVAGTLRGQRPGFVLTMTTLAVLANAAGLVATMVSWRAMLAGVGERVPAVDAARIFYFGQLVKYVPGKVMGFLVSVEMGRAIGVPAGRMSAAWLLALVVSLLTGATVGLAAGPEVFGAGDLRHRHPAGGRRPTAGVGDRGRPPVDPRRGDGGTAAARAAALPRRVRPRRGGRGDRRVRPRRHRRSGGGRDGRAQCHPADSGGRCGGAGQPGGGDTE